MALEISRCLYKTASTSRLNYHFLAPPDVPPFGEAVLMRATQDGGWLTWVVSIYAVAKVEACLENQAIDGHRTRPSGQDF